MGVDVAFLESWMSRTAHFRSNRIGLKNEFLLSDHLSFRYVKMNGDWVWHVHIKAALYFLIFRYLYNERKNKEKENSNMKQVYHSKLCEYAIYHWILDFVTFSISAWSYASMGFSLHSVLECESIRRPNSKYIPGFTLSKYLGVKNIKAKGNGVKKWWSIGLPVFDLRFQKVS